MTKGLTNITTTLQNKGDGEINCGGNMAGWLSQLFEMGVVLGI